MLLYSTQLTLKGRILFLSGMKREAEEYLKEALTHIEGRKGREKPAFRCRLYLDVIKAQSDPESSSKILELLDCAPDSCCKGETYYCHWKLTADGLSASRAAELLTESIGSLQQPVIQRLLDDLSVSIIDTT